MSEELKTMKDLEREISENYIVDENTNEVFMVEDKTFDNKIIFPKELRAEAVKWAKYFKRVQASLFDEVADEARLDFIVRFFNLTEEDLK